MRSSFIAPDYGKRSRVGAPVSPRASARSIASTGPAPPPSSRSPLATASPGERRARCAPPAEALPERQRGGEQRPSACSPSRARRRRGGAGPRSRPPRRAACGAVERSSVGLARVAVPARQDHGSRAERAAPRARGARPLARRRPPRAARRAAPAPRARSASARSRAAGSARRARPARPLRAAARRTRRPSPGRRPPACPPPSSSSAAATASVVSTAAEHPDLHRVDADVRRHRARPARARSRAGSGARRCTPSVFCAVIAVIAQAPWTPQRGERLEVGLDAGAAARVRAGDRERDRGPCGHRR